jgi:hypothetical protein
MLDIEVQLVTCKSVRVALILSMVMVMKLAEIALVEDYAIILTALASAFQDFTELNVNIKPRSTRLLDIQLHTL